MIINGTKKVIKDYLNTIEAYASPTSPPGHGKIPIALLDNIVSASKKYKILSLIRGSSQENNNIEGKII